MLTIRRVFTVVIVAALFVATPGRADAQAEVLTGLLGNATDFNFFWTQVGSPRGDLRPERSSGASGVGFEFAFEIPGSVNRPRLARSRSSVPTGDDCMARFERGALAQDAPCADTTVARVSRTRLPAARGRPARDSLIVEEIEIDEFSWEEPLLTFELAVGFSQSGAFVSRRQDSDIRLAVREAPFVSLYVNYEPGLPPFRNRLSGYFGARSGVVSLVGARVYNGESSSEFDGETFQVGPVGGMVFEVKGFNFFVEGAYMFRDMKTLEWEGDIVPAGLPRRLNLTGPSLAVGVQFRFNNADDK